MNRIALALLLIALTLPATAATYYVDDTGSDTNPGTEASPFRTIQHGVDQLDPGDQLYVRSGTYNEYVLIWYKYGTSSAPIYITNYPGETPVIDGTGIPSDKAVVGIGGGSSYIRFDGFEVKNGPGAGIYMYNANNIKVRYNKVHDMQHGGIQSHTPSGSAWGTNNNIVIHGNTVYHCVLANSSHSAGSGWQQAISAERSNYVEITGNYVYENHGEGIDYINSDNGTITGNKVWDNYSCNIYLDNAQYTKVDGNMIENSGNTTYYRSGNPAGGIVIANETYSVQNVADNLTITNNIVLRTHSGVSYGDWEYNGGMHNSVIANNVFYSTTYATIWIQGGNIHTNVLVANNIFYQKYNRPYASSTNTLGLTYQYNVWYGGGDSSTIISGAGDITSDPKLVNAGGGSSTDYKLQSTSPCINAGTSVSAVTKDYWGTTRAGRGSAMDIGVHEY